MDNPRYLPSDAEKQALAALLDMRSFPALDRLTISYIEKITGKPWNDEAVLDKIRAAVTAQKESYWKEGVKKSVTYKGAYSVLGYMAYQMPGYVIELAGFFSSLISAGLLRKKFRVLDVGAGPGTAEVAMAAVLSCFPEMSCEITAVERAEPHREAYAFLVPPLLKEFGGQVTAPVPVALDITAGVPAGDFDLIICANVINELTNLGPDAKTDLIMKLSSHLVSDGSLVLIEPADLENASRLRLISRSAKERGLTIYAPCNDLRGVPCGVAPCWTFQSYADIRPTRLMFALGGEAEKFRFVNTDVKFSYAVLRVDGHRRCGYRIPADAKRARLSQIKRHVGKRIHVTVSVMSQDIGDAKNYLYLVCDGTGLVPCYIALPAFHRTPEHEALLTAAYGAVVAVDSVLVRFNEKQNAYNLLMGQESFTRFIAGGRLDGGCPDKAKALREKYGSGKGRKGARYPGEKQRRAVSSAKKPARK